MSGHCPQQCYEKEVHFKLHCNSLTCTVSSGSLVFSTPQLSGNCSSDSKAGIGIPGPCTLFLALVLRFTFKKFSDFNNVMTLYSYLETVIMLLSSEFIILYFR